MNDMKKNSNTPLPRRGVRGGVNYSQPRAMLAITKASLRSILRNPSSVVFSILFPLIFIIVFGFIGGGGYNVEVGVLKTSNVNNPVYIAMQNVKNIKMKTDKSDSELLDILGKGKLDAVMNITQSESNGRPFYSIE